MDEAIARITVMDQPPTALCCLSDGAAAPAVQAAKAGIGVPNDMSLIGFDDSDYAAEFGLTTIHQDPQAWGARQRKGAVAD